MAEPVTKSGRIIALHHTYNGAAITHTRAFFDDGTNVVIDGALTLPAITTVELTYNVQGNKNILTTIILLAG